MKVSAALQILTAVMSSPGRPEDDWSQHAMLPHATRADDVTPRADLDLGACLDIGGVEEFQSQTLYNDDDDANAWVENVIEMTSRGDLTTSGEYGSTAVVPGGAEMDDVSLASSVSSASSFSYQSSSAPSGMHSCGSRPTSYWSSPGPLSAASDNATFACLQTLANAAVGEQYSNNSNNNTITITVDFSQLSDNFNFAASDFDNITTTATSITTTTIDTSALGQLMTANSGDVMMTSQQQTSPDVFPAASSAFAASGGVKGGNIPNSLWNLDLAVSTSDDGVGSMTSESRDASGSVRDTVRSRLYSRSSAMSASVDSNTGDGTLLAASNRSLSSSSSSLTQWLEEECDTDDPSMTLEKREKNRLAAQKCRNRKRVKTETLEQSVSKLEERQEKLKQEVEKLRDQRETLEQIINVHGIVCPKMRKTSHNS